MHQLGRENPLVCVNVTKLADGEEELHGMCQYDQPRSKERTMFLTF